MLIGVVTAAASLTAAALAMGGAGIAAAFLLHRWLGKLEGSGLAVDR